MRPNNPPVQAQETQLSDHAEAVHSRCDSEHFPRMKPELGGMT